MMNYNKQTNVSRKKIVSSQDKTLNKRDNIIKKSHSSNELSSSKLSIDKSKIDDKLSNTKIGNVKRNLSKNLLQQNSLDGPSTSLTKLLIDRPIIDQSVNSSVNVKFKEKILNKTSVVSQKSNINTVRSKSKKLINDRDEKRGVSTIFMPKKSNYNAKELTEASKKNRSKLKVKNKDESHVSSRDNNSNKQREKILPRERKNSRTLSPSEIKILKSNIKTSNLQLNNDLIQRNSSASSDNDYEDDFEDYESDFQECTDSDEKEMSEINDESEVIELKSEVKPIELQMQKNEKKIVTNLPFKKYNDEEQMLDSGHYELQEARRRAARIDLITANQSNRSHEPTIERSILYCDEKPSEIKSLPSSTDEGFEDGRSGDFPKSSQNSGKFHTINLKPSDIIPNEKQIKSTSRRLKRGKQLLQMIKLDVVQWTLYESNPIAYDEFIRIHGKINTRQISTQTNDDNLSVEVQTDEIKYKNMWTQFPITCRSVLNNNEDINLFTVELAGVGSDENIIKPRPQYDILELNEFICNAGSIILTLLESKQLERNNLTTDNSTINQLPFIDMTIKLSIDNLTFLANRPAIIIRYSDVSSKILLTIHNCADEDVKTSSNDDFYLTDCCIGCQWNIFEPSRPIKLFYSSNNITACHFHPTNCNIVFGGLEDGSLSLWDLGENEIYHRHVIDRENKIEWTIRSATFNTCGNYDDELKSKIVSLVVLSKIEMNGTADVDQFIPLQICSLDENGNCIVWSVLKNFHSTSAVNQDLGQSWWGKLRLIKSHKIQIDINNKIDIQNFLSDFRDINVDTIDTNNLYVATNMTKVLHVTRFGGKPQPTLYNGTNNITGTTCIEICPFGQPFFLVGCDDGSIRFYSSTIEKPIFELRNSNCCASIKTIQWSKSRPLIIYVLDNNSNIHIWDLSYSNNSPVYSVTPNKYSHVISLQLSSWRNVSDMKNQYIAIGLDNGSVEINKLNKNYYNSHMNDLLLELKILFNYLEIY